MSQIAHLCLCVRGALIRLRIDSTACDAQVEPLPAVQSQLYSPSAGLFVLPEAAQTCQNGGEAASLQQLCLDAARRHLQPCTVCSTLQVTWSREHAFPCMPID